MSVTNKAVVKYNVIAKLLNDIQPEEKGILLFTISSRIGLQDILRRKKKLVSLYLSYCHVYNDQNFWVTFGCILLVYT